MQLHISAIALFLPSLLAAPPAEPTPNRQLLTPTFTVLADDSGAWPQILASVGFQSGPAATSTIFVLRGPSPNSPEWSERVEKGAFLILEGESPLAEAFGFRRTRQNVRVGSIEDIRRPKLPIIWQKAVEMPKFEVSGAARVFAKERWTGAPLLAGVRKGTGAVLWVALNPGEHGYERFPYILHALSDLGVQPPFRSSRLWAFFDYSYRTRVDLDYFAARWRASGISVLHVAAWHFYEPDPDRDEYLRKLIQACHRNAVLVYAWLELPHVSEKFWNDHPEWREKTAVLQDAHLDWRKLMNLFHPECFRAVSSGVRDLIQRFPWDGVNLAELYFESLEGASNPSHFTPMNDTVRALFRQRHGFDPIELFQSRKDEASLRLFLDFRAGLAGRMQREWMAEIESSRRANPDLAMVLTHVDDRFDSGMRDAIGADAERVLPLLDRSDFTFLIEDPATIWHLGPQRYPEIAKRYQPLTAHVEKLAIDINVVDRYQDVYPTKQQTGTELFQLVQLASRAFAHVALYFENSILPPDVALLPYAGAVVNRVERIGSKLMVDSPQGVGMPWVGPALVDAKLWPVGDGSVLWLPPGAHSVEPVNRSPRARILDFNGTLKSAQVLSSGALELSYQSSSRALAVLDKPPVGLEIDGIESRPDLAGAFTLLLPRGQHLVSIRFE